MPPLPLLRFLPFLGIAAIALNACKDKDQTDKDQTDAGAGGPNQPPRWKQDNLFIAEGQNASGQLLATDPNGDPLSFHGENLPKGATLSNSGLFRWSPNYDQAGDYTFGATVTDGQFSVPTTLNLHVSNTNRPPTISRLPEQTVNEGEGLSFTLMATDPDGDPVRPMTSSSLPTGAMFDGATGLFEWTPNYEQAGSYEPQFSASDGSQTSSQTVRISVVDRCEEGITRPYYTGPSGTSGRGICESGVETCVGAVWSVLPGDEEIRPSREICDGLDDDCNGSRDAYGRTEAHRLATGASRAGENRLLWNGSQYSLFWRKSETTGDGKAYLTKYNASGYALGVEASPYPFQAAWLDVIWEFEYGAVMALCNVSECTNPLESGYTFVQVDSNGAFVNNIFLTTSNYLGGLFYTPSLVHMNNGNGYAITGRSGFDFIEFGRLTTDGELVRLEPLSDSVTLSPPGIYAHHPDIALDDGFYNFGVVYTTGSLSVPPWQAGALYFTKRGFSGEPLVEPTEIGAAGAIDEENYRANPQIHWNGSGYNVAYQRRSEGTNRLEMARINEAGAIDSEDLVIVEDLDTPIVPLSLAGSETLLGATYMKDGELNLSVFTPEGVPIGVAVQMSDDELGSDPYNESNQIDLVYDGSRFSVIWKEGANINFAQAARCE